MHMSACISKSSGKWHLPWDASSWMLLVVGCTQLAGHRPGAELSVECQLPRGCVNWPFSLLSIHGEGKSQCTLSGSILYSCVIISDLGYSVWLRFPHLLFTHNDAAKGPNLFSPIECLIHHCYRHRNLFNPESANEKLNTPNKKVLFSWKWVWIFWTKQIK